MPQPPQNLGRNITKCAWITKRFVLLRLGCLAVSDSAVPRLLPTGTGIKTWRSSLFGVRSRSWNAYGLPEVCIPCELLRRQGQSDGIMVIRVSAPALYLVFIRVCGRMVLSRSPASKNAELLVLRHEVGRLRGPVRGPGSTGRTARSSPR